MREQPADDDVGSVGRRHRPESKQQRTEGNLGVKNNAHDAHVFMEEAFPPEFNLKNRGKMIINIGDGKRSCSSSSTLLMILD